jgi:hypothetical protein
MVGVIAGFWVGLIVGGNIGSDWIPWVQGGRDQEIPGRRTGSRRRGRRRLRRAGILAGFATLVSEVGVGA